MESRPATILLCAALSATACTPPAFDCTEDAQCRTLDGVQGSCEQQRVCSFPDEECASGRRFGEHAGKYSDQCVALEGRAQFIDSIADGVQPGSEATVDLTALLASSANQTARFYTFVSSKNYAPTTSVQSAGVNWNPVAEQCGVRATTGIAVWGFDGVPEGEVRVVLASEQQTVVVVVAAFSVSSERGTTELLGTANAFGTSGACDGELADETNTVTVPAQRTAEGLTLLALAARNRSFVPETGATILSSDRVGEDDGVASSVTLVELSEVALSDEVATGSVGASPQDWAGVVVEIDP